MPSHSHRPDRQQVNAWIPLAQWLAIKAAASALGCAMSDIVARCIELCAADVIREEREKRDALARRLVARNDYNTTGGHGQC